MLGAHSWEVYWPNGQLCITEDVLSPSSVNIWVSTNIESSLWIDYGQGNVCPSSSLPAHMSLSMYSLDFTAPAMFSTGRLSCTYAPYLYVEGNMIITVPAIGIAPHGAKPSADKMMTVTFDEGIFGCQWFQNFYWSRDIFRNVWSGLTTKFQHLGVRIIRPESLQTL